MSTSTATLVQQRPSAASSCAASSAASSAAAAPLETPAASLGDSAHNAAYNAAANSKLPFTLPSLRAALPPSVFVSSTPLSIYYFARDYAILAALYYFKASIFSYGMLAAFVWMNAVGFFMWCLFVVGHDCGHGTFSSHPTVNELFGLLSHSPLLVPFTGWQRSHFLHHTHHNNVEHDHSWRPTRYTTYASFYEAKGVYAKIQYALRFGWLMLVLYPVYLLSERSELASGNHFWPGSKLFPTPELKLKCALSTVSVLTFITIMCACAPTWGWLITGYVIPYFIFCVWLDVVTLLHHTTPTAVYYRDEEWSYLKGALTTTDRTYFNDVVEHLHHNIGTHVVHHLFFTSIPHYNLLAANAVLKKVLGDKYYTYDSTPILQAVYNSVVNCKYVDDDGKQVKYKNEQDYERERDAKAKQNKAN